MAYDIFMKKGTQANYKALGAKDANTVYFCTDSGNVYLGEKLLTGKIEQIQDTTGTGNPGIIYFNQGDLGLYIYQDEFIQIVPGAIPAAQALQTEKFSNELYLTSAAVKAYVENAIKDFADSDDIQNMMTKIDTIEGDVETNTNNITELKTKVGALETGKADKATDLAGYGIKDAYTKTEVDDKVTAALSSALTYKGTKDTYAELPAAGENKIGDVWNIAQADDTHGVKAGDNVAWSGTDWDVLAGTVDMSNYSTTAQVEEKIDAAKTAAAQDAQTKATEAETNAKAYADGLATNYATADQGAKADTALQKADIESGKTNGSIKVKGDDVAVTGLQDAAFATVESIKNTAVDAAKAYTDAAFTWGSF